MLMSSYTIGTDVTKNKVLDTIEKNGWVTLSTNDLKVKHNRNELVWRNDFAFVRKHLEQNGYYISGIKNDWSLTEKGINELKHLCNEVIVETHFSKISNAAINNAKNLYIRL